MVDVTVRGAGVFGLAIGFACLERGASLRLVDPNGPGAGASGGMVGALAPHVPENWNETKAFQFASLAMAEDFWAEVARIGGKAPGYARSGRLMPIADERGLGFAREREIAARELWQGRFRWEIARAPEGWGPASPTGLVIHESLSARISPRGAVAALVAAIRALGGEVSTEAPDEGQVVWATGAAGLSEGFARPVGVAVKGQAALLRHDAPEAPQIFAGGVHIVPHEGGTIAIGSTTEREFADPTGCDARLDAVIERARAACPAIANAPVIERWAGLRARARTRAPILGPWPGRPGHYVANGGFKIGLGLAPMVGKVMADLLLDGKADIPDRFRVEASL